MTLAGARADGLATDDARARLDRHGPNRIVTGRRTDSLSLLLRQVESPLILILAFAAGLSGVLGDAVDALIILAILLASGLLGFWQERGATRAVDALRSLVSVRAEVLRDGRAVDLPMDQVVPGDITLLTAGDLAPGDGLILESRNLLVDESALTGEAFPVEKSPGLVPAETPMAGRVNAIFLGTHVVSGDGRAVVLRTGSATEFGHISASLGERRLATSFERGMTAFGGLLIQVTIVLVVAIFVMNLLLARPVFESLLFSLALAVGLTPQLLPAIVTISLSQGARQMAHRRVIVKRLDAIEDFGAMTVLCTDKTGTMTVGSVGFDAALGPDGQPSSEVRRKAWLNARHQRSYSNPIDQAIVAANGPDVADLADSRLLDELPYDFSRRRLSVLVAEDGRTELITKGALESVLAVCSSAAGTATTPVPLAELLPGIRLQFESLSAAGYRVLGLASRDMGTASRLAVADEAALTFQGFLTFSDPPKPGIEVTVRELDRIGVSVRMITGDNRLIAAQIGRAAGIGDGGLLTGSDLARLDDRALAARVQEVMIFAEIDPAQKERIIEALRASGRTVGYLGDGINDSPALHAADIGISVDTAVDVAKESAAIVLLEKDLGVLCDGVLQGRRTFANTMKYIFVNTSASFGNMLSLAMAAIVLPFLPLLATQILLLNFLTDFPALTIAADNVDPEQLARPQRWDIAFVRTFMLRFGVLSSVFDLITFAVLRLGFGADETTFRSGWFLESVGTEIAVLLVLRTARPFFRSRPGGLLLASTASIAVLTLATIYGPVAGLIGFDPLALPVLAALLGITALYVAATELVKRRFYRRLVGRPASGPEVPVPAHG